MAGTTKAAEMPPRLPIEQSVLEALCRRHHMPKLSLFGSTLKDTARPDSNIDLLGEFEPDRSPGLIALAGIEIELAELMGGRRLDMRTPGELSRHFRDEVLRSAAAQYAA